jgi:hypothetical protein
MPALNSIVLAQELLEYEDIPWSKSGSQGTSHAVDVLLEEMGHWLDATLNSTDSAGDEGAMFSALVQGKPLSSDAFDQLKAENDWSQLIWQGQQYAIEQAAAPGMFTIGPSGQIVTEFLFDSGAYTSQIGIFSLTGMEALQPGSTEFIQEAARRVLSNSFQGCLLVSDPTEGASRSGELGEPDLNAGPAPGPKTFAMQAGDTVALMLVPNGLVKSVVNNPTQGGAQRPLFSIAAANPNGGQHFGAMTSNAAGLVMGIEDIRFDGNSDADYNDLILKLEGATGQLTNLTSLIQARRNWPESTLGQELFAITPRMVSGGITDPTSPVSPTPPVIIPPVTGSVTTDLNTSVVQFSTGVTEAELIASGAASISLGTQTIYIGTNQVAGINQNPILASFDAVNPNNTWVREDYETTGADGRGNGLAVTQAGEVYAFFSVDGTQGIPAEDFRRVSQAAEQAWLRSYGQGGGPKVSVLGKINPATGELTHAAYLSAILSNGNSNTLTITGLDTTTTGNLLVSAESFFSPRQPNGQPLTLDNDPNTPDNSPFDYFVEITPDLKQVESTSAVGWV